MSGIVSWQCGSERSAAHFRTDLRTFRRIWWTARGSPLPLPLCRSRRFRPLLVLLEGDALDVLPLDAAGGGAGEQHHRRLGGGVELVDLGEGEAGGLLQEHSLANKMGPGLHPGDRRMIRVIILKRLCTMFLYVLPSKYERCISS